MGTAREQDVLRFLVICRFLEKTPAVRANPGFLVAASCSALRPHHLQAVDVVWPLMCPLLLQRHPSASLCHTTSFLLSVHTKVLTSVTLAISVHATQHFWWVSWINPLADAKHPESREGLSICNTQQCSLTCLDYVTFAMFTFPPDRTQCLEGRCTQRLELKE